MPRSTLTPVRLVDSAPPSGCKRFITYGTSRRHPSAQLWRGEGPSGSGVDMPRGLSARSLLAGPSTRCRRACGCLISLTAPIVGIRARNRRGARYGGDMAWGNYLQRTPRSVGTAVARWCCRSASSVSRSRLGRAGGIKGARWESGRRRGPSAHGCLGEFLARSARTRAGARI